MNSPKIVLFDIDGTLMRGAGPHHKEALIAATKQVLRVECTLDGIDTSGRLDTDLGSLDRLALAAQRLHQRIVDDLDDHLAGRSAQSVPILSRAEPAASVRGYERRDPVPLELACRRCWTYTDRWADRRR